LLDETLGLDTRSAEEVLVRNTELGEASVRARGGDLACKFRFTQDLIGLGLVVGDGLSSYQ
jgi:hypothetical protein